MVLQLIRNTSKSRGCEKNSKWEFLCLHMIEQTEVVMLEGRGTCFSRCVGATNGLAS